MLKLKKSEIGVWKTVKAKVHHKHEKEKLKPNKKLLAKSSKQKDIKHASRPKNFKQTSKYQVHHRNRQWNNFPTSMPFVRIDGPRGGVNWAFFKILK